MHFRDRIQILWFWRAKKEADPICLCIMRQKESWNNWQDQGRNKLCLLNEALYLLTQNYTDHVYTKIKVFKSRFANKRNRKWAFFAKSGEKNRPIVFWEKIRKLRLCPHLHRKKNLNVSKTKPVVPRGHPKLLLLFYQNKSCMHNEVGTCTEILPIIQQSWNRAQCSVGNVFITEN